MTVALTTQQAPAATAAPAPQRITATWCTAGMVEAGKQFRRVNGHLHLPALRAALERETPRTVTPECHDQTVNVS